MDNLLKRLTDLIRVKTIVTLMIVLCFCIMSLRRDIDVQNFMVIATAVITFYFAKTDSKGDK